MNGNLFFYFNSIRFICSHINSFSVALLHSWIWNNKKHAFKSIYVGAHTTAIAVSDFLYVARRTPLTLIFFLFTLSIFLSYARERFSVRRLLFEFELNDFNFSLGARTEMILNLFVLFGFGFFLFCFVSLLLCSLCKSKTITSTATNDDDDDAVYFYFFTVTFLWYRARTHHTKKLF